MLLFLGRHLTLWRIATKLSSSSGNLAKQRGQNTKPGLTPDKDSINTSVLSWNPIELCTQENSDVEINQSSHQFAAHVWITKVIQDNLSLCAWMRQCWAGRLR